MANLPLTQGSVAIVDDELLAVLMNWNWHLHASSGYPATSIHSEGKSIRIYLHRFVMGAVNGQIVDHIDGNKLNNQRSNLRFVSSSENAQNARGRVSVNGFRGVSKVGKSIYAADLYVNLTRIRLGRFKTALEAALAYDLAVVKHFGDQALTNEKYLAESLEWLQKMKKGLR